MLTFFVAIYDGANVEIERHPAHRPIERGSARCAVRGAELECVAVDRENDLPSPFLIADRESKTTPAQTTPDAPVRQPIRSQTSPFPIPAADR